MPLNNALIDSAKNLRDAVDQLTFASPTEHVYNPLAYAWNGHRAYLQCFGSSPKKAVFLGMNPGPWGMAQTGVPFGEIAAVRDWMGINTAIEKPTTEHPKRPILGFECEKSEVSGRRLWGLFQERFGKAEHFFNDHFVLNYCPLVFMEESSKNRTPDKLPASESAPLFELCDAHLREVIQLLKPEWIIGVGGFAQKRAALSLEGVAIKHGKVLHPSPASPAANRGWAEAASKQLHDQNIWTD